MKERIVACLIVIWILFVTITSIFFVAEKIAQEKQKILVTQLNQAYANLEKQLNQRLDKSLAALAVAEQGRKGKK